MSFTDLHSLRGGFVLKENVIIQSKHGSILKIFFTSLIIVAVFLFVVFFAIQIDDIESWEIPFLIGGSLFYGSIVSLFVAIILSSYQMVITDKRVYGKILFGRQVDIPLDQISSVSITGLFKGVSVYSDSGKVSFGNIKNYKEMHNVISNLLIARQGKNVCFDIPSLSATSNADEIKKYKELLDIGAITKEEFDAKKMQLLDL